MLPVEITSDVYWVGVNDRLTDLFEGLWPIKNVGVSYNSYLINDDKKAVIDLSKAAYTEEFIEQISRITDPSSLDYIIVNHMEPDHTGAICTLRNLAPRAVIVGTERTQKMLGAYYGITEGIQVVRDGDSISLGNHTLKFISTPFVHWPETMMTYDIGEKILFSCDAFGSFGALKGTIFQDQYTLEDVAELKKEALRYYVNIVAQYNKTAGKAVEKLADVPLATIAPSHGPIWQKNIPEVIDWYKHWVAYASGRAETGVALVYASMYRNTEHMMEAVAQGVASQNIPLTIMDAGRLHVSHILPALLTHQGVIIGAPTYEGGVYPPITYLLKLAEEKKIGPRQVAYFGSYGWGIGAREIFTEKVKNMGWNLFDTLVFNGRPTQEDLENGVKLGERFAQSIKAG